MYSPSFLLLLISPFYAQPSFLRNLFSYFLPVMCTICSVIPCVVILFPRPFVTSTVCPTPLSYSFVYSSCTFFSLSFLLFSFSSLLRRHCGYWLCLRAGRIVITCNSRPVRITSLSLSQIACKPCPKLV